MYKNHADTSTLDGQCIMTLFTGAICEDHFCDGALLKFYKDGRIQNWLESLLKWIP